MRDSKYCNHQLVLSCSVLSAVAAWNSAALGQTAPAAAPPAAAASSAGEPTAAPAPASTTWSAEQTSTEVLRLYVAEDDAGALALARDGLSRCDLASRRDCPDASKALLLRDLGIVQAGAYRDHAAAVASFKEALKLEPTIAIPPDLLIDRVRAAFSEAGGNAPAPPADPAAESAQKNAYYTPAPEPQQKTSRYDAGDTFVLAVATLGGAGSSVTSYGEFGGALSGLWHVTGPLAFGARLSGAGNASYGVVGAAGLLGVLPRGQRNTGYFALGLGPDYVPEQDRVRTMLSLNAGASFGGFTISGMPAVIWTEGRTDGGFWFTIGWGNYVKD